MKPEEVEGAIAWSHRLLLRTRRIADAADEYRWQRDPEIAALNATEPLTRPFSAFHDEYLQQIRLRDATRDAFAIDALEPGGAVHIGTAMYYRGDHHGGGVEIGMTIGERRYWSNGFGREAALLFLRHLWASTPFTIARMQALETNERAIRCFAGLGFGNERPVDVHGRRLVELDVRREWWQLWDMEGRFARYLRPPEGAALSSPTTSE